MYKRQIRAYEEFGRPAAGVSAVPWADVSRYCSLKTTPIHDNYFFVDDMIAVSYTHLWLVSRRLARPVAKLSAEVAAAEADSSAIPHLSATGIRELDQFSSAFTQLSKDVLDLSLIHI